MVDEPDTSSLDRAYKNAGEICYNFSCPIRPESMPNFSALPADKATVFQRGALITMLAMTHSLPDDMTVGEIQKYLENKMVSNNS